MRKLFVAIGILMVVLALYNFAGTSDQLDNLTVTQQQKVVARWQQ